MPERFTDQGLGAGEHAGRDLGPLAGRCTSAGAAAVLQAAAEATETGTAAHPVHLLVALGRDTGAAGRALAGAGLNAERLRELLPEGTGDPEGAPALASDELASVVEAARTLATVLDGAPSRPGPNHLLVVLLSPHPWGVAPQIADLGVDPDALRRALLQTL